MPAVLKESITVGHSVTPAFGIGVALGVGGAAVRPLNLTLFETDQDPRDWGINTMPMDKGLVWVAHPKFTACLARFV